MTTQEMIAAARQQGRAALDEMAETSRLALSAAPADPVLNQYYISTLGAREVTLRQLGSVLTPGKRLSRF